MLASYRSQLYPRVERALDGFAKSKHRGYPKMYATIYLANGVPASEGARIKELDRAALQHLVEAFNDGSILADDQRDIAVTFRSGLGSHLMRREPDATLAAFQKAGQNAQWVALFLEGDMEIDKAWAARGNGYVNTVTEAGWKGFEDHLAKARKALTKASELRPDFPEAPCAMMRVALGAGSLAEMRMWFDRAIADQIDYADAWRQMRWGLRPRWYGDPESMLAFGVTALNTKRFDTDVPRGFFESVSDLEAELDAGSEHLYGREDIWPHFQAMYQGYIHEASKSESPDGWRSTYAAVAFLARKYDVAAQQLELLQWKPLEHNLTGWDTDLSLMPMEVAARISGLRTEIEAAEKFRTTGDTDGALGHYKELAKSPNLDARTRTFIQDRIGTLDLERRLASGEWVSLLGSKPDLMCWSIQHGDCRPVPDGGMEIHAGPDGHLLYSRARVGTEFEAKGKFEILSSSTRAFEAGFVMGLPEYGHRNWDCFRIIRTARGRDEATLSAGFAATQINSPASVREGLNSFTFRFDKGKITATLNDQPLFSDVEPPENRYLSTNEFHVGLGAYSVRNETVIRYSDLQVRRLPVR